MTTDESGREPPTDRESPVGQPVIRGDAAVTGDRADAAVGFDPDDPDSVSEAAATVRAFAETAADGGDQLYMLRGAAACAALVRGVGSYKVASERTDGVATVSFIQKWARVHDLPRAIRRCVAMGKLAPSAAKHVARVAGDARYQLAWAALDNELTVHEVRAIASEVNDGSTAEAALEAHGVTPGELTISLPPEIYRRLRRAAVIDCVDADEVVAAALAEYLSERD